MIRVYLISFILFWPFYGLTQSKTDSLLSRVNASGASRESVLALLQLTRNYSNSRVDSSIYFGKWALELSKRLMKEDSLIGVSYKELANTYYNKPYFEDSAIYFGVMAEQLLDRTNYFKLKREVYTAIAKTYLKKHEYPSATKYYQLAIDEAILSNIPEDIGWAKSAMIDMYRKAGNCEDAIRVANEVIQLATRENNQAMLFSGYRGVGICHDIGGAFDSAEYFFNKALEVAVKIGYKPRIATSHGLLGVALWHSKKFKEAETSIQKAIAIHKTTNSEQIISSYQNLCCIYRDSGLYDLALQYCQLGLAEADKRNQLYSASMINNFLSEIYEKKQDYAKALEHLRTAKKFGDSLNTADRSRATSELEERFKNKEKQTHIQLLSKEIKLKELILKEQQYDLELATCDAQQQQHLSKMLALEAEEKESELLLSKLNLELKEKERRAGINALKIEKGNKIRERNMILTIAIMMFALLIGGAYLIRQKQTQKLLEEKRLAILTERKRISADMHDELGSEFTKISLLSELLRKDMYGSGDENVQKIAASAQDALHKMGEIVWSLNPRNDYLDIFISYLRKYAMAYLDDFGIHCVIESEQVIPHLEIDGNKRRQLFLVFKETLNNIVKHAQATRVEITFSLVGDKMCIAIHDNGKGIKLSGDAEKNLMGNGLRNMRERMENAGGHLQISNHVGTKVCLQLTV